MKKWICAITATVLCLILPLGVLAEETRDAVNTTIAAIETTENVPDGNTTAKPDPTTTSAITTAEPTKPTAKEVLSTTIELTYRENTIQAFVKDENGQGVAGAPLVFQVDGNVYAPQKTDTLGKLVLSVANKPNKVVCTLEPFDGRVLSYDGATATLNLGPVVTNPPPSVPTSPPPVVTTTKAPTKQNTVRTTGEMSFPSYSTTITRSMDGDAAITEATETAEPGDDDTDMRPVSALAIAILVIGILLLIAAGLMVYFFLIRKPKDEESEEEETDTEGMPIFDNGEAAAQDGEENAVSLDELFGKNDSDDHE